MYIEYVTPQRIADPNITEYNSKGGAYRPTWLIRTSDWEKVPGTDAVDGYHTLSYCWEQSGEKHQQKDGEYSLIDEGGHKITKDENGTVSSVYATYDELLQQMCKDFDIEYLWYDKICIDQTNKAEKHREIKQMHLIYSNARYTLALVPEISIEDPECFDRVDLVLEYTEAKYKAVEQMMESLWFQRSWTLEEVMMSTQILVVGRDTHFWSLADIVQGDKRKENDFLANMMLGFKDRTMKSANQVLHWAHRRTSTKEHDKIFALANIFADLVSIDVDYDSDVPAIMNAFYRQLAQRDLSLMCFGSVLYSWYGSPMYKATMGSYGLPSWTGTAGLHTAGAVASFTLDQHCDYTIDENMVLHMRCRYHTIHPTKYGDSGIFGDDERMEKAHSKLCKVISSADDFDDESEALDWSQWIFTKTSGGIATHYYKPHNQFQFFLPVLPLSLTEECDECVILGAIFTSAISRTCDHVVVGYVDVYFSPIARKSVDGSYKIIGMILLKNFQHDEPRISRQELMDKMFNNLGCEATNDFYIK